MLAKLRERTSDSTANGKEPQRVITVRLPKSMHEALKEEAKQHRTSMNKLCISKLLQVVDDELVPAEWACKPGSVPRSQGDGHFSRTPIARRLKQPTRKS